MGDEIRYIDFRGLFEVWPSSKPEVWPSSKPTVHRAMKRDEDPFPPGKIIGGKRYWLLADVLAWLARQDDPAHQVKAA